MAKKNPSVNRSWALSSTLPLNPNHNDDSQQNALRVRVRSPSLDDMIDDKAS